MSKYTRVDHSRALKRPELQEDIENIKLKMRETGQAFAQAGHDAKDAASDIWNQSIKGAKDRSKDIQDDFVSYVKANPVKSIGYAALGGIILGFLLRK